MFEMMPFNRNERKLMSMFDDFDRAFFSAPDKTFAAFKTDVLDQGDRYILQAELPGFEKEDIHIDMNGDSLTVRAERSEEKQEEDKNRNFVRRERSYGAFARSFDISGIDAEHITAKYQNGVLELELPKKGEVKPASKQISIE